VLCLDISTLPSLPLLDLVAGPFGLLAELAKLPSFGRYSYVT